jgi:GT2 family glycosyltransferase
MIKSSTTLDRVTIITVTYNRQQYLARAFEYLSKVAIQAVVS